jgi:predicted house-cleaning NTP pyrophosphatase (Maf/HAM1 superfamily)
MLISRKQMERYLLKETRLTQAELNKLSDKTIERYYKEEKECNKQF